jgi:hypothetical protein
MADEQELKLSVSFVDNATPGLLKLKQTLQEIGGGDVFGKIARDVQQLEQHAAKVQVSGKKVHEGITESTKELAKFASQISGLPLAEFGKLAGDATRSVGGLSLAIAALPALFLETNETFKQFADQMGSLDVKARSVGIAAGELKKLGEQVQERIGGSFESAETKVTSFLKHLQEVTSEGPKMQAFQNLFPNPGEARAFFEQMEQLRLHGKAGEAMTQTIDYLRKIEEAGKRDPRMAPFIEGKINEVMAQLGLGQETRLLYNKKIEDATKEELEAAEKQIKAGEDLRTAEGDLAKALRDLKEQIITGLSPKVTELIHWISEQIKEHPAESTAAGVGLTALTGYLGYKGVGALGRSMFPGLRGAAPAAEVLGAGGAAAAGEVTGGLAAGAAAGLGLRGAAGLGLRAFGPIAAIGSLAYEAYQTQQELSKKPTFSWADWWKSKMGGGAPEGATGPGLLPWPNAAGETEPAAAPPAAVIAPAPPVAATPPAAAQPGGSGLRIPGAQGFGSPWQGRRRSEIEGPVQLASLGIPQGIEIPEAATDRAPGMAETFFRQRAAMQEQTEKTEEQTKATAENTDQLRRIADLLDPRSKPPAPDEKGKAPAAATVSRAPAAATESVPIGNGIVSSSPAHTDVIGPAVKLPSEPASMASSASAISAKAAGGGSGVYQRLLAAFRNSNLIGVVPRDGARFGIRTGSAEEWARFGTAVASAESGFNPNEKNLSDPGGSFGIFQYAHSQVPGRNAYDVDASVKAFVRDAESSAKSGSLGGGILGRRFSTIGSHPERTASRLGEAGGIASRAGAGTTGAPMGTSAPGAAGDPTVPTSILTRARAVAFTGGPGAVEQFMKAQGYPKAGNWCGEFAASVVKASGYRPPPGAAIASNWRNFGVADPTPHPGDIAVADRGVRTGSTGSHVTVVESVDPKTGTFVGLGGNQRAGFESNFKTAGYTFRRPEGGEGIDVAGASALTGADGGGAPAGGGSLGMPGGIGAALGGGGFPAVGRGGFPGLGGLGLPGIPGIDIAGLIGRKLGPLGGVLGGVLGGGLGGMLDRGGLDRSLLGGSMTHLIEGTGKLSVDVSAPAGTGVRASGGGLFKHVEMNRQTQMTPTVVGPHLLNAVFGL